MDLLKNRFKITEITQDWFEISKGSKKIWYDLDKAKMRIWNGNVKYFNCGVDEFIMNAEKHLN